jgi:molybdenum cofactor cytidylyltransferase
MSIEFMGARIDLLRFDVNKSVIMMHLDRQGQRMNVVGILLAAGKGRRFDPSGVCNKLLEQVGGEAVAVASARAMLAVLPQVIAVVPSEHGAVATALRAIGCQVSACPHAARGMAASLAHGLRHAPAQGWIIALADMPYVERATIAALRGALENGAGIAAPVMDGRRGNPVAFGALHLAELLALEGDQGARALLKVHAVTEIAVNDPGIFRDIDTAADLA